MATTVSWNAQRIQSFPQTGFLETSPVDQTIIGQVTEKGDFTGSSRDHFLIANDSGFCPPGTGPT
jgi:hypothetical protein